MDQREYTGAIQLHAKTNRLQAHAAAQRGDFIEAGRCNEIAAMADTGRLLAPRATEHNIPDLVAGAAALGRLVESPDVPPMGVDQCRAAIKQHGVSYRLLQKAATMQGNHGAAKRLDEIATAAEDGKLLASDASAPHLAAAAAVHGLLVDDSGAQVQPPQASATLADPYVKGRLGGQPLGPKLEGQT
jgi:hypothetical protein